MLSAVIRIFCGLPQFRCRTGTAAQFAGPGSVAVDSAGNVYVVDYLNYRIRKMTLE